MGRRGWLLVTMALVLAATDVADAAPRIKLNLPRASEEEKSQDHLRLIRAVSRDDFFTLRCKGFATTANGQGKQRSVTFERIITIDLNSMYYQTLGSDKTKIERVTGEQIYHGSSDGVSVNRATGEYSALRTFGSRGDIIYNGTCQKIDLIPFGARKF
jgi:hypothetical protein